MRLKPFIYLSESLVTARNNPKLVQKCAQEHGYTPDTLLLQELWDQAALSTRAQLQKYNFYASNYKQVALKNWHSYVVDQLFPAILPPTSSSNGDSSLKRDLVTALSDFRNYTIPEETDEFIKLLESSGIHWGIIANDNHLYPLTIKHLGLKPFKLVSARQHVFKPLPQIFETAWSKVPASSQYEVWFIGDSRVPYDNVAPTRMRTVLHTHGATCDTSNPSHMRIATYSDLIPFLGLEEPPDEDEFAEFDMGAEQLREFLELPKNKILSRGERDPGLVDVPQKKEGFAGETHSINQK